MVDFDNEKTVTVPAYDIIKVLILQRRNDIIDAIEAYNRVSFSGVTAPVYEVQARIFSLFLELGANLSRSMKKEEFEKLEGLVNSKEYDSLILAFRLINSWLDKKRLIMLDTTKDIDTSIMELDNASAGMG